MKIKRSLATVLAGAVVLSSLSLGVSAANYPDVKDGYWASSSIDRWSGYGVVKGDTRGQFNPEQPMKRGELATMLADMLGLKDAAQNTFHDVPDGKWYAEPILKCAAAGIMQGDTRGNANPESPISRQEAAVMLGRALGIEPAQGTPSFSDGVEDWAAGYVKALADKGIVNGVSEGVFGSETAINRASVATILDRAVTTYSNQAGETVEAKAGGITLIAAPDVVVTGEVADMLVTPGAAEGKVTLQDAKVTGTVKVDAPKAELALAGKTEVADVVVAADAAKVAVGAEAKADSIAVEAKDAALEVSGTVKNVEVAKEAEGAAITANKDAKITNVTTEAKGTEVKGEGKVETVKTTDKADTKVETKGTKTEEVKTDGGKTEDTKKPSGGGSSGGSSGGNSGSSTTTVNSPKALTDALAAAKDGDVLTISGTLGDSSNYTSYDVKKAVTIKGDTVYGAINLMVDGATLDGITIYSRGGGDDPMKNAVNIVAAKATVRNCQMHLIQENSSPEIIGNAIVIYPTKSDVNYDIADNTFTAYEKSDGTWASSGISVTEGFDYGARFGLASIKSVASNIDDRKIALGNTYVNCSNEYVRVDWTNGGNGNYKFGYYEDGYSSQFTNSTGDATLLLAGTTGMGTTKSYPKNVNIEIMDGANITIEGASSEGASSPTVTINGQLLINEGATLTVESNAKLVVNGKITNNGTKTGEGTIIGTAFAETWKEKVEAEIADPTWDTIITAVYYYDTATAYVNALENVDTKTALTNRLEELKAYYAEIKELNLAGKNTSKYDISSDALRLFTGLEDLDISGTGLADFTGLTYMPGLKVLNLSGLNDFENEDFGAIAQMQLTDLNLRGTGVTDIGALGSNAMQCAGTLQTLDISDTGVTTLQAAFWDANDIKLPALKTLTAKKLSLTSITGLVEVSKASGFNANGITWNLGESTLAGDQADANVSEIQTHFEGGNFTAPTPE